MLHTRTQWKCWHEFPIASSLRIWNTLSKKWRQEVTICFVCFCISLLALMGSAKHTFRYSVSWWSPIKQSCSCVKILILIMYQIFSVSACMKLLKYLYIFHAKWPSLVFQKIASDKSFLLLAPHQSLIPPGRAYLSIRQSSVLCVWDRKSVV